MRKRVRKIASELRCTLRRAQNPGNGEVCFVDRARGEGRISKQESQPGAERSRLDQMIPSLGLTNNQKAPHRPRAGDVCKFAQFFWSFLGLDKQVVIQEGAKTR
jgi:hypothetical protein